jgi:Ca-activated chloride channel homolog
VGGVDEAQEMINLRFVHPWFFLLLGVLPVAYVLFRRYAPKTSPGVDGLRLAVRLLCLLLVIAALASPQLSSEVDRVNVLYLVDVSDSMGPGSREEAMEYIDLTARQRGADDTLGVTVFGADVSPEIQVSSTPGEITMESLVDPSGTDIEGALYRSVSLFPDAGENRIILISDGNETTGEARNAARALASMNIQVHPVRLEPKISGNEVLIQSIVAPRQVNSGQVHDVTVLVHSETDSDALLYIFRDGVYMGEDAVALRAGSNRYTYTSRIDESGSHLYEVYVQTDDDTVQENNRYRTSVRVRGEPAVLYVSGVDDSSPQLLAALAVQGITVAAVHPESIPTDLQSLLHYDAVVFDNVPAFDISIASMELLERYVKDAGGGFLMIGGDNSFGIGGYYATPIEKALPVDMDVTSSMNIPSLALLMVVDKSGSMGDTIASGETKLDLVKEAVIASIEVLNPFYTVGLLAFDADYEWTVPPTNAGSRQQIIRDMAGLATGGGTHLYPALEEAFNRLENTQAAVKHVLVLSDGLTDEGDFERLAAMMRESKITVSTVSVGGDSDRELMAMIADLGGGRSYFTDDIQRIPRIFASESIIVSRGLVVEEPFIPMLETPSEIVDGLDITGAPPIHGFVLTYPKAAAQTVLSAFNNYPLLTTWRYGLGKTAAYMSDFKGKWGLDLVAWDDFPLLASQLVRWLRRSPGSGDLTVSLDESGVLSVDAVDEQGNFINGLLLEAIVLSPDGGSERRPLNQSAPGFYQIEFDAGLSGDYYLTVFGDGADRTIPPETHILTIPYPREYNKFKPDTILLDEIARMTGGSRPSFSAAQGELLYAHSGSSGAANSPLWRALLIAALLLFLIDIALRMMLRGRNTEDEDSHESILERIRRTSESRSSRRLTYEELLEHLRTQQRRESERRDVSYWFGSQKKAPDTTLRLYLARKRKS